MAFIVNLAQNDLLFWIVILGLILLAVAYNAVHKD